MRKVTESRFVEIEDMGHGYSLARRKDHADGHIQSDRYLVWHDGTGVKYFFADSRAVRLPKKFKELLRAYAAMKLSGKERIYLW